MSTVAKSILNVTAYQRRWADNMAKRIDRHFDDRDMVLGEAMRLVEQWSDDYYPAVTALAAALTGLASSALTGLTITGTNFVAATVKASGISDEDSTTKELTWTRIVPGDEDITITIATSGVANHTVTAAWNPTTKVLTVTRGTLATAAEVVTAIGTDAAAKFIVSAEATGDGTGVPTAGSTTLTGGKGALPVLHLGSIAVDGSTAGNGITGFTDTTITFCVDASALSSGTGQMLRLWVDDMFVLDMALVVDARGSGSQQVVPVMATVTASAEGAGAANAFDFTIATKNLEGDAVARTQRYVCEAFGADMVVGGAAGTNLRLSEVGVGSEVSTTAKGMLIIDTGANGAATVRMTDNSGSLAAAAWFRITPVTTSGALQPGFARIVTVTFA